MFDVSESEYFSWPSSISDGKKTDRVVCCFAAVNPKVRKVFSSLFFDIDIVAPFTVSCATNYELRRVPYADWKNKTSREKETIFDWRLKRTLNPVWKNAFFMFLHLTWGLPKANSGDKFGRACCICYHHVHCLLIQVAINFVYTFEGSVLPAVSKNR